jgi:hypothetical protein
LLERRFIADARQEQNESPLTRSAGGDAIVSLQLAG